MGTGKTQGKRRANTKKKGFKKYFLSTKHRSKDLDQIQEEIQHQVVKDRCGRIVGRNGQYELDEDIAGGGQFYCIETGRHFADATALAQHKKTKEYKRRLKELKQKIYTQDEADAGAGLTKEILPPASLVREEFQNKMTD